MSQSRKETTFPQNLEPQPRRAPWHKTQTFALCLSCMWLLKASAQSVVIDIPGDSCPWLAGMPGGTIGGDGYDTAPSESPVLVSGISVAYGMAFSFSANGSVNHSAVGRPGAPKGSGGPGGQLTNTVNLIGGAENGIGELSAPMDALVGVFLDDNVPSEFSNSIPASLFFTNAAECDFTSLSPVLRQPFFIGTGETSAGTNQLFIAPTGATRLFLGTMDSDQWTGNQGSFTVTATAIPFPAFNTVHANNGSVTFNWSSVSNQVYQVQYSTNLTYPNWVDLGDTYLATNAATSGTDSLPPDAQRFYRVLLLP